MKEFTFILGIVSIVFFLAVIVFCIFLLFDLEKNTTGFSMKNPPPPPRLDPKNRKQ